MEIRELPEQPTRVETGPVRFGHNDFAGTFIRGDNSFYYAMQIRTYLRNPDYPFAKQALEGLAELLELSNENK